MAVDIVWVFSEIGQVKGLMDGVWDTIKRSIDDAVAVAETKPNVVVKSSAVVILFLSLYDEAAVS